MVSRSLNNRLRLIQAEQAWQVVKKFDIFLHGYQKKEQ